MKPSNSAPANPTAAAIFAAVYTFHDFRPKSRMGSSSAAGPPSGAGLMFDSYTATFVSLFLLASRYSLLASFPGRLLRTLRHELARRALTQLKRPHIRHHRPPVQRVMNLPAVPCHRPNPHVHRVVNVPLRPSPHRRVVQRHHVERIADLLRPHRRRPAPVPVHPMTRRTINVEPPAPALHQRLIHLHLLRKPLH